MRPVIPRLAPAAFALLLVPLVAGAQTGVQTIALMEGSPATLSRVDCEAATQPQLVVTWAAPTSAETERVFVSRSDSCPKTAANPGDEIVLVSTRNINVNDNTTAGRAVTARELFDLVGAEGEICGDDRNIDQRVFFCVVFSGTLLGNDITDNVEVRLDTTPPATPQDVTASPLNQGLQVEWSMPTDLAGAARYRIYVTPPTGAPIVKTFEGSGLRRGRVDGLVNDTEYTVEVTAVDDAGSTASAGNESPRSEPTTGTPVTSVDFWAHYHDLGGQEQGGCASSGGVGLMALVALLFLRRRATAGLAAVAVVASLAAPATAQDLASDPAEDRMHSPRYGTFELRTGPYYPNVDDEPGLTGTPFADVFKSDSSMLWRAEVGLDLIDWVGRLGIGGSIGWTRFKGKARLLDGSEANDDTTFAVLPLTAVLTYRADFFHEWWGIPLVPYGKVGYGFVRWWTELDGNPSQDAGEGSGWARGLELSGGVQLVLDGLEREQAAELDQDFGINSTSLFFDATWVRWKGNPLLLQDTIFSGGLLIAF